MPNDGSVEDLIDRKAKELAMKTVLRTSNTTLLSPLSNSQRGTPTQRLR